MFVVVLKVICFISKCLYFVERCFENNRSCRQCLWPDFLFAFFVVQA